MPSAGLFFLILGLIVASGKANDTETEHELVGNVTTNMDLNNTSFSDGFNSSNAVSSSTMQINSTTRPTNTPSSPTAASNMSSSNSTINPSTTVKEGVETSMTTPTPIGPTKGSTSSTTIDTNEKPQNYTGIAILIVIIVTVVITGILCYCVKKRGRRYSVDHTSRLDEVNVPLSAVPLEIPADVVAHNGMQTFESTKDPQEQEAQPEVHDEQKAEAEKCAVGPSAECAAPASAPGGSGDKPKEVVVEQSPLAAVKSNVEEKTDDEDLVSNKTSVESLKEINENNSNNADLAAKGLTSSNMYWDVPLNSPV